jgi:hypothetical protein
LISFKEQPEVSTFTTDNDRFWGLSEAVSAQLIFSAKKRIGVEPIRFLILAIRQPSETLG